MICVFCAFGTSCRTMNDTIMSKWPSGKIVASAMDCRKLMATPRSDARMRAQFTIGPPTSTAQAYASGKRRFSANAVWPQLQPNSRMRRTFLSFGSGAALATATWYSSCFLTPRLCARHTRSLARRLLPSVSHAREIA